jgi:hypothetical protein
MIMTAATAHRRRVNHKFTGKVQEIANVAFRVASDSATMRWPSAQDRFGAPTGSTAIGADQKLRS